jgi:hypothetical protein
MDIKDVNTYIDFLGKFADEGYLPTMNQESYFILLQLQEINKKLQVICDKLDKD